METDIKRIAVLAAQKETENQDFRYFVKYWDDDDDPELIGMVSEVAAYYSERIKCGDCANCCKVLNVPLNHNDIHRLSQRFGMSEEIFVEKYLEEGEGGLQIRQQPCPFLDGNKCSVYDIRPDECRDYPYLDREIVSRMWGVIDRSAQCPIVYNVLEELKTRTGFRRKKRR